MLSSIFDNKPSQWGLRGDPYLWEELSTQFRNIDIPSTEEDFLAIFKEKYMELTKVSLDEDRNIYIERFSRGGMSSGMVSYEFWRERALPLLLERYRLLKEPKLKNMSKEIKLSQ